MCSVVQLLSVARNAMKAYSVQKCYDTIDFPFVRKTCFAVNVLWKQLCNVSTQLFNFKHLSSPEN